MISHRLPNHGAPGAPASEPSLRCPPLAVPLAPDGWLLHNYFHTFLVMVVKHSPKGNLPPDDLCAFHSDVDLPSCITIDGSTIARIALSDQHHPSHHGVFVVYFTGSDLEAVIDIQLLLAPPAHFVVAVLCYSASSIADWSRIFTSIPSRLPMRIPSARDRHLPRGPEVARALAT
ncbi:hypothetical protein NA56DRAFT_700981 [Hyaloscypha hepaticicola]|uniref:Uncharacterized protein n=1 Tax=Hyaloscypha hepaticicola TaxID=2082293 RepID=A0A2J6QBE9_9HELO|nr:hypothetical protein NA56DRAFT_700981 [Hyaloscypha hepaticicola]